MIAYVPGIGPNYTRNEANAVFQDLTDLKADIRQDLINFLNQQNYVGSVKSAGVDVNPLKVRLYQTGRVFLPI